MPSVTVNGKQREVAEGVTLRGLIEGLGLHERTVAVEHNRKLLKRAEFAGCTLRDGDQIEIVRFVQGG